MSQQDSAATTQLARQSYSARIADLASAHPGQAALTFVDNSGEAATLTWQAISDRVGTLSRFLAGLGCRAGTRVIVKMPNRLLHPLVCIGAWRLGACVLPLSDKLSSAEHDRILEIFQPAIVVSGGPLPSATTYRFVRLEDLPSGTVGAATDELPHLISEPGLVVASGGSTGQPKLIVDRRAWGFAPGDVERLAATGFRAGLTVLISGPMYHTSPFTWLHKSLMAGNPVVLLEHFDPEITLDALERYGIGFFPTVPTVMTRLIRSSTIRDRDLSKLSALYHTGGPCPDWVKEAWIQLVGGEHIYESYGSTENLGPTRIRGDDWLKHRGSVGIPTVPTRIVDQAGSECPTGEIGLIFQRPASWPRLTFQYLGAEAPAMTADGYLSVGDYGRLDADGYLYVADRRVDMIVSGGANIYPAEVEAVLLRHPDIADAVVVGIPDDLWGSRVHAVVQIEEGAIWDPDALIAFAREWLTPYKVPKEMTLVERIPRAESGKIRRQLVRNQLIGVRQERPA